MLDAFQISLADRLRALPVSPEIQAQLVGQSSALANLKIPDGVGGETQAAIRQVVRESFVAGFRLVAYLAAGLAAASALAAWLLIAGKARREAGRRSMMKAPLSGRQMIRARKSGEKGQNMKANEMHTS